MLKMITLRFVGTGGDGHTSESIAIDSLNGSDNLCLGLPEAEAGDDAPEPKTSTFFDDVATRSFAAGLALGAVAGAVAVRLASRRHA